jgi:ubiquinone/menaquinone biosynthesis C-methylase UbiE
MTRSSHDDERARLAAEYERREREVPPDFYSLARPANLFFRHGQERALLRGLRVGGMLPLAGKRILEVGCGEGQWFATFESFSATRDHLAGIDLDGARADACRSRFPGADVRQGDAAALPWGDSAFDIVFQSTLFTSILKASFRDRVAAEMQRVLRPGGAILWYDFVYDNPANPNVRGIRRAELRRLFPRCTIAAWRVTLAPPLARRLVSLSWTLAALLESIRALNTHDLAVILPQVGATR